MTRMLLAMTASLIILPTAGASEPLPPEQSRISIPAPECDAWARVMLIDQVGGLAQGMCVIGDDPEPIPMIHLSRAQPNPGDGTPANRGTGLPTEWTPPRPIYAGRSNPHRSP